MVDKRSWACTLVLQLSLCVALYLALNLGHLENRFYRNRRETAGLRDVYFISVRGGYRNLEHQMHLLKQVEKMAKFYNARFVVNISELGEDDPLTQNASRLFPSTNIPWYSTGPSKVGKVGYFHEKIKVANEASLGIVGVDTGLLQDLMLRGSTSVFENEELNWLTQTLEPATYNWLIVVGYHPVIVCDENKEQREAKQIYEQLHHIFVKYGVNAYLSRQGCPNHTTQGVAYIGIPKSFETESYLSRVNEGPNFQPEMKSDGFLLHRVSSLEFTTYFVTTEGKVVSRTGIGARNKEAM